MSQQPIPTRLRAIAAIVRKDLHLAWPLALMVAALQFITTALLHEVTEFPGMPSQVSHPILTSQNPLFWIGAVLPALLAAIFIIVTVQSDTATDRRRDWLTRPVGAVEIAAAKSALVLSVVFAPYFLGAAIFTLTHQADPAVTMLPVLIILRNCLFGIMLAWLVSSALQALLAMVGLLTLSGLLIGFTMAVLATIYFVGRAHAGLPIAGVPDIQPALPTGPRVLLQLGVAAAMMWPVLWLLLVRRRATTARLVFITAYVATAIIPYAQFRVAEPAKKAPQMMQPISAFTASEATHE